MLDSLPRENYRQVWIEVRTTGKRGCDWSTYPASTNCEYLKQLLAAVKGRGITVGIYSDYDSWKEIFNSVSGCVEVGTYPLWYEGDDTSQSFKDYRSFGGFGLPVRKRY